jgi:hypothetical protein
MVALAVTDLTVIENHARIPDLKLMEALEFGDLYHLQKLISRHRDELETYGVICGQTDRKSGPGRPATNYMLNEEQALLVCMFARTPKAAAARRMIVDVFMKWKRGEVLAQATPGNEITIGKDEYIALLRAENARLVEPPRPPRKAYAPLTEVERAEILRLTKDGMGVKAIARLIGRSGATVSLMRAGFRVIEGGAT